MNRDHALILACAAALTLVCVCAVIGRPYGDTGWDAAVLHKSNKPGFLTSGQGCAGSGCHGTTDSAITATLSGPSKLFPGQSGTYTLTTSRPGTASGGVGFDIAADDPSSLTTILGEPENLYSDEIVHGTLGQIRTITTTTPTVTHSFTYTMPAAASVGSIHNLYAVTSVGFTGSYQFTPNFAVTASQPPTAMDLTVTNVTSSSLNASWTGLSPEFRAIYKANSLPTGPMDGTLMTEGASTSATVSGLSPDQRYFIAVYGKVSGSASYSATPISTSVITLNVQTIDTNSRAGSGRFSNTSQGQLLFVDDPGVTDVVKLFNGSTVSTVEAKGAGQNVDFDDIGLGSGATAGHVIAVWRRDQDDGHLSVDGGTPVLITGTNPINAGVSMNLERLAVADGCVFAALQCDGNVKNVYKIDPANGNGGNPLTSATATPGVVSRLVTSDCKAAWGFDDGSASKKLQYTDGSPAVTADSGIGSGFFGLAITPSIAHGKIVYVKAVGGIDQVFLYDTTAASPAPVQLTNYTDGTKFIDSAETDGRHVVWFRGNSTNTASEIDFDGGLTLSSPVGTLSTEAKIQLNRGQLLWRDSSGNFRYETATSSSILPLPATTFRPWLNDGYIGYGDTATAGAFLFTGTAPIDAQQPAAPMVVQTTLGASSVTLHWDAILGAMSYDVYYANEPGLTKANYATLAGGTRIMGLTSPTFTLGISPNVPYYFVITTVDGTGEGPESRQASVLNVSSPIWTSVGGLSTTSMNTASADRTQINTAYAAGGNNTYKTTNGGFSWTALGGGIAGVNVRAIYADNGRVFATSPTGSIYASTNGGTNWSPILSASGPGEPNQSIVVDPAVPNTILASDFQLPTYNGGLNDSYVIRSDDGGATWFHTPQAPTSGADLRGYTIAVDPTRTSTTYAGGSGTPNVAKSIAGGAGWTDAAVPVTGTSAGYIYTIVVDPENSRVVYAGVQQAFGSGSKGVYKSTNGGATWTVMNTGLTGPPGVRSLIIDPADHNIIHAGSENGYFYSLNGGASWTADNSGLSTAGAQFINSLAMTESHRLIAATGAGLYLLNLGAVAAPAVASVSPNTGAPSGGTAVTISGTGFQPGATVTFGAVAATSVNIVDATSITAVTPAHAAGQVNVVVTNGDGQSATLTNGYSYTTLVAPANLVATAQTTSSILLTWSDVSGAVSYEIARRSTGLGFSVIGSSPTATFTDTVPPNTAHLYEVRAVDTFASRSAYSNIDLATSVIFTDDPIVAQSTIISAAHVTEMRTAVNAVRALAGLASVSFTDPNLTPGVSINPGHVRELRTGLDAARSRLFLTALSYTDPALTAGVTRVKAAHLQELRQGVK